LIVGKGKLLEELMAFAKKLDVENEVIFLGFIENIKSFYESIDIFLLSSIWEGFGYVIAEAMAAKKAVVAYDISSNPELIINNKTGFLVEKNKIETFVEKIEWFISNPAQIKLFGERGRNRVEDLFTIEKAYNNLLTFLRNC
jgi:glycosyltransferase involved in cell wall biosynthesis